MLKIEITGDNAEAAVTDLLAFASLLTGGAGAPASTPAKSTGTAAKSTTQGKGKVEGPSDADRLKALKKLIMDQGADFRPTAQKILKDNFKATRTDDLDPSDYEDVTAAINVAIEEAAAAL